MTSTLAPPPPVPAQLRRRRRVVIIGAGLGGLAAALRLHHAGYHVVVLEKNQTCGGRANRWSHSGFTFDTGPSILLMRYVFDELYRSAGETLDEHVELLRLHPNYRCIFADGSSLTLTSDLQRLRDQLEQFERGAGDSLLRFLADAGHKYSVLRERFLVRNFRSWGEFLSPGNLPHFVDTGVMRRLGPHVARRFRDPRLQTVFSFHSMYVGTSPQAAPSVFAFLPYSELVEGIWYPRGGMYRLVESLVGLLRNRGVEVRCGAEVRHIEHAGQRADAVLLAGGERVPADVVVCNADLPWAYENLLGARKVRSWTTRSVDRLRYGCSAVTLYLGVRGDAGDLLHHNFYFGRDMPANYRAIFGRAAIPEDPAFYVNVATRTDPHLAPDGHHAVFVLGPSATADKGLDWRGSAATEYRDRMLDSLSRFGLGDVRERVTLERMITPDDWREMYNLRRGATFGVSHDFFQCGYMRPANRHPTLGNLYFVGASTVPGCGVPTVVISGQLVAERIAAEIGSG